MPKDRASDTKKVKNQSVTQSTQQSHSSCSGNTSSSSGNKNGKTMSSSSSSSVLSNNRGGAACKQNANAAAAVVVPPQPVIISNASTPTSKSDTTTEDLKGVGSGGGDGAYKDSSDSDEESVSEVDSFPIDQESIEIPESYSDSTIDENEDEDDNDVSINYEDDDDGDEEDSGGSEAEDESADDAENDPTTPDQKIHLAALLEAADEARQVLSDRTRSDGNRGVISKSLQDACNTKDITAVRKILGENSTNTDGNDDGDSLLSLACSAGYYELAQVLLAMSAQVEDRGQKNDCTPLMEAASAGHIDIIELLLKNNAKVNATSTSGNTPLMYACAGGHVDAVRVLLQHGANVEDHNENGHTPLMEAASAGHVEVARVLLEHGAGINTHSNEFKESALTLACYKGHLDMVRFLLEAGADQEHKTDEMHTALMEASMDGHVEVARLLLDSGAQVNMPTDSFESPLTLAACGGHTELALLLIERGANIEEVNDEGYTPLMEAAREGHEEMVGLLLSQGANINAQTEETQETALTLACCGGFLEVADYLLKQGAEIETGASTPLMEAAQEGHVDLVKYLLDRRANVHAQTQTGDTALTYACENGHTDVAETLLSYGAELEHESEGGRTPLMKACRAGHACTASFLISRGANVNRQTANNDHTPLSLACAGGHLPVVEILLQNGADLLHKLKDNSTMLIEAAKGGHLNVVQLLLDPKSIAQSSSQSAVASAQQETQTVGASPPSIPLKQQQQQQQQQMMATPPGLPDTIRGANQLQLHTPASGSTDDPNAQMLTYAEYMKNNSNFMLDTINNVAATSVNSPSSSSSAMVAGAAAAGSVYEIEENSLIAQMRKLAIHNKGFKDGLMQGFMNNNNTNTAAAAAAVAAAATRPMLNVNTGAGVGGNACSVAAVGKQKSLLRKNRQPAAVTSSSAAAPAAMLYDQSSGGGAMAGIEQFTVQQQQQLSGDKSVLAQRLGSYYDSNKLLDQEEMIESIKKKLMLYNDTSIQQIVSSPSAFNDSSQANTLAYSDPIAQLDNAFPISTLPTIPAETTSDVVATNAAAAPPSAAVTASPHPVPTKPSEVSQSTAIADRPKVKPVSKKDGKYIKKSAAAAIAADMMGSTNAAVFQPTTATQVSTPTSEQSMLTLQQGFSNLSMKPAPFTYPGSNNMIPVTPQSTTTAVLSSNALSAQQQPQVFQQPQALNLHVPSPQMTQQSREPFLVKAGKTTTTTRSVSPQQQQQQNVPFTPTTSTHNNNNNCIVPLSPFAATSSSSSANPPVAEQQQHDVNNPAVVQMNPEMLQKIAHRLLLDPAGRDETKVIKKMPPSSPTSPTNSKINSNPQMNFQLSEADLENFYSQLAVIHPKFFAAGHEAKRTKPDDESYIEGSGEENMQIFQLHESDAANEVSESVEAMYPTLEDTFNPIEAFDNEGNRETCSMEWVECFDEVLNALNNLPVDIPGALQEFAANCSDYDYANLFSMNTYCKARWADQWPTQAGIPGIGQQHQHQHATIASSGEDDGGDGTADNFAALSSIDECGGSILQDADDDDDDDDDEDDEDEDDDDEANDDDDDDDEEDEEDEIGGADVDHRLQGVQHVAFDAEQLQHHLSLQHLTLINQLQNSQHQGPLPLIPVTSTTTLDQQNPQSVLNIHQAQQELLQQQQQQQQQQKPLTQLTVDAQQQKFVFNMDPEKANPSLQLLFQLPTAASHQGGTGSGIGSGGGIGAGGSSQSQPLTGSIITSNLQQVQQQQAHLQQSQLMQANQVVAQTQTCQQQQQQQQQQQLRPNLLEMSTNNQHCTQHQVATQTSTPSNVQMPPSIAPRHTDLKGSGVKATGSGPTKKAEKRLKDRKYPARPTPTGQSGFQFDQSGIPMPQFPVPAQQQTQAPNEVAGRTIDVDSETDSNHDTALTLACAGGHEELVELLLSRGANIEHRDKKGFTPLILAATAGHVKVVEILIREKADLEAQSERTKDTPLSLACSGGRYEVVEILLKQNANKEHRNVSDYTPLSLAASGGYVNIIKMLLSHGAEINSRTGSKLGISPLMLAAMNGHTQAVKLLLDMGSDINAQIETNRNTALTLACFQGRHEVVSLLLDRKANVEHRAKTGLTPLMEAASGGYIEVGRVLLDKGADVNAAPVPSSRDTALTIAADKGHLKFVELLLSRNAAVEVKNKKGNSPLWLAANGGHLGVIELLFNAGADIDSEDNRKVSCLMAAFRKGHTKTVQWMVQHVSQFPSDQEMIRFINTINEKEKDMTAKCNECVKIINNAKDIQSEKARLNASILLRELETEKNREEQRKAAAAKRRARKKRRKQAKKELKLKEDEQDTKNQKYHSKDEPEDSEDSSDDSDDEDGDEEDDIMPEPVNPPQPPPTTTSSATLQKTSSVAHAAAAAVVVVPHHHHPHQPELRQEKEEGDSGIDANSQGSCSSSDNKGAESKAAKRRNKQKIPKLPVLPRASNSPESVVVKSSATQQPTHSHLSQSSAVAGIASSVAVPEKGKKPVTIQRKTPQQQETTKKSVEKENLAPPRKEEEIKVKTVMEKVPQPVTAKMETTQQRKALFGSTTTYRGDQVDVDTSTGAAPFYNTSSKKLNVKSHHTDTISPNKNHGAATKCQDGWKEVVRKQSSVQQSLPTEVKKVQVPTNAISRVIGRAGSNINAIRAATGAHIEVEKQGKVQVDRCITIKGSCEATKQAQLLINTLIKENDVDIVQVLAREGIGKVTQQNSGQIVIGTWDKSKPSSTTSSQDGDTAPSKKGRGTSSKGRSTAQKSLFETRSKAVTTSAPRVKVTSPAIGSTAPKVTTSTVKTSLSFASRVSAAVATNAVAPTLKKMEKPSEKLAPLVVVKPNQPLTATLPSAPVALSIAPPTISTAAATAASIVVAASTSPSKVDQRPLTPIGQARVSTPTSVSALTSVSAPSSAVKAPPRSLESESVSQIHSVISTHLQKNSEAKGYSLFNNAYGSQWDNNQYMASVAASKAAAAVSSSFAEPPESSRVVDVAKAPGYRGMAISSPVNSKTSGGSTSATPPSSSTLPTLAPAPVTSTPTPLTLPFSVASENIVAKPATVPAPIQPPNPAAGLAVQRPPQVTNMRPQLGDSFAGMSGPPPLQQQQQQQPQPREHLYDSFPRWNEPYPPMQVNPLQMSSRLNPKASSFSSSIQAPPPPAAVYSAGPKMNQPLSQIGVNMYNNYQPTPPQQQQQQQQQSMPKMHPGTPVSVAASAASAYNQARHAPNMQNNPSRWYSVDLNTGGYGGRGDAMMAFENGGGMPSMPENVPPSATNGLQQMVPPLGGGGGDDSRRIPRPIGTERNWKYGGAATYPTMTPIVGPPGGGVGMDAENGNGMGVVGSSWQMDNMKQPNVPMQPWMQPSGLGGHRGPYDDMTPPTQDHYQQPPQPEYMIGPNPSVNQFMQTPPYQPFMNQNNDLMIEPPWEADRINWHLNNKWTQ